MFLFAGTGSAFLIYLYTTTYNTGDLTGGIILGLLSLLLLYFSIFRKKDYLYIGINSTKTEIDHFLSKKGKETDRLYTTKFDVDHLYNILLEKDSHEYYDESDAEYTYYIYEIKPTKKATSKQVDPVEKELDQYFNGERDLSRLSDDAQATLFEEFEDD